MTKTSLFAKTSFWKSFRLLRGQNKPFFFFCGGGGGVLLSFLSLYFLLFFPKTLIRTQYTSLIYNIVSLGGIGSPVG